MDNLGINSNRLAGVVGDISTGGNALHESLALGLRMSNRSNNLGNELHQNQSQPQLTSLEMQHIFGSTIASEQNARRNQLLASLNSGNSGYLGSNSASASATNESPALHQLLQRTLNSAPASSGNSAAAGRAPNINQQLAVAGLPSASNAINPRGWTLNATGGLQVQSAMAQSRAIDNYFEQHMGRFPGFLQSASNNPTSYLGNNFDEAQLVARVLRLQNNSATLTHSIRNAPGSLNNHHHHHQQHRALPNAPKEQRSSKDGEEKMDSLKAASAGAQPQPPFRPVGQRELEKLIDSPPTSRRQSPVNFIYAKRRKADANSISTTPAIPTTISTAKCKNDDDKIVKSKPPPKKRRIVPPPPPPPKEKTKATITSGKIVLPHYSEREKHPLGIDEDQNWLSEFQCYARAEMMEVFKADREDVVVRSTSKSVKLDQVGVRCRFCAHIPHANRVNRSSAFPSGLSKLYQSFNMMVRDHFAKCSEIPENILQEYLALKGKNSQGACDSRHYWYFAAKKLGMVETDNGKGIEMTEETIAKAKDLPSYGFVSKEDDDERGDCAARVGKMEKVKAVEKGEDLSLLPKEPLEGATPFFTELLSQMQIVHLLDAERVGKRKTLPLGLEGFGCRYCYKVDRLGFSRCYPLRRRGLPAQVYDMYVHLQRCTVCPSEVKARLKALEPPAPATPPPKTTPSSGKKTAKTILLSGSSVLTCGDTQKDVKFMDIVWSRLNRTNDLTT